MILTRSVIKSLRRFFPALILFAAIAACRGQIIVHLGPPATITIPGPFTTDQYTPVVIDLPGTDSDGEHVGYSATASVGTVELQDYVFNQGPVLTYSPDTNHFFQGATITLQASDPFDGLSVAASIAILPGSPIVSFTTSPTIVFPGTEAQVVIVTSDSQQVLINFDGSGTVSTNSLSVSESWYEGTNCIVANGQSGSVWESPGSHIITMTATDGVSTNSGSQTIEILTPGDAVSNLEMYVAQSGVPEKTSRELQRILSKAEKWADQGKQRRAYIELFDLQRKLQSRHDPLSPEISTNLVTGAQEIIDKLSTAK